MPCSRASTEPPSDSEETSHRPTSIKLAPESDDQQETDAGKHPVSRYTLPVFFYIFFTFLRRSICCHPGCYRLAGHYISVFFCSCICHHFLVLFSFPGLIQHYDLLYRLLYIMIMFSFNSVKQTFAIHPCSSADRAWLHYLLMIAVALVRFRFTLLPRCNTDILTDTRQDNKYFFHTIFSLPIALHNGSRKLTCPPE